VEELLAERGVEVDHVTVYRWVQRLTPLSRRCPAAAARCRKPVLHPRPRQGPVPVAVTTDKAGPYLQVFDELVPAAAHVTRLAIAITELAHAL